MKIKNLNPIASDERLVPSWELLVSTPAVRVRVANTGLTGYGK
jgi:hypothetical protein